MHSVTQWIKERLRAFKNGPWRIEVTSSEAISLKYDSVVARINWTDVQRISAYKADRITWDPIIVVLERTQSKETVSFEELTPGYQDFIDELHRQWASIDRAWIDRVNKGAFVRNHMVLWEHA